MKEANKNFYLDKDIRDRYDNKSLYQYNFIIFYKSMSVPIPLRR